MPFTLAHPVIFLPFKRHVSFIVLVSLVIGAIVPDFSYCFPQYPGLSAHTAKGLIVYCLPWGISILGLFVYLYETLVFSLPNPVGIVFSKYINEVNGLTVRKDLLRLVLCLILGSASHIVWDSFTHAGGWFVQKIPLLQTYLGNFLGKKYFLYNLLQHLSSLIFFIVLYLSCKLYLSVKAREKLTSVRIWYWSAILFLSLALGTACAIVRADSFSKILFYTMINYIYIFIGFSFVSLALFQAVRKKYKFLSKDIIKYSFACFVSCFFFMGPLHMGPLHMALQKDKSKIDLGLTIEKLLESF